MPDSRESTNSRRMPNKKVPSVSVPLSIMVSEHKQTIKALKSSSPKEKEAEIKKQTNQLKRYQKMKSNGL